MKKVLTRNIPLKILSLLLAVVLWVVIMNIDDPYITKKFYNIPVLELNTEVLDELGKIYEVESGQSITITVKGKRSIIEGLKNSDFEATANFKEKSDVNAVPIRVVAKPSPNYDTNDIEIIDQNDMMTLSLEEADTQTFRVNVNVSGKPKDGYYVTEKIPNPNIIEISGSKKQIQKIKDVVVDVSVEMTDQSFEVTASPKALDENGYPIGDSKLEFQTKDILVNVRVLPMKEVPIVVSTQGNPYYGYEVAQLQYEPKVVTVAGTQEDLDKIGYITIPFDINLRTEDQSDTKSLDDFIDTSKYTIVGNSNSVAISAEIEKLDSKDVVIHSTNISVDNLNPQYEAIIHTPGTISLHVMGTESKLMDVTAEKLQPSIDLENLEPGTYSITLNCTPGDNLTVRPVTISVEIVKKTK
ncbi:MAG: CdaR family protein [Clostridiales bacterium]|nr:CdaR family protein [Clostridiales bacterium]